MAEKPDVGDVTRLIQAVSASEHGATDQLLTLVYDQLRKIAQQRMNEERAGHTLQATALVHEAYLRLVGDADIHSQGRGYFFAAAAEAMRRILVERARRKQRVKHGGDRLHVDLERLDAASHHASEDLLDVDDALARLAAVDPMAADVVKLRYFAGLAMPEVADALGIPLRTAERTWTYARVWLHRALSPGHSADGASHRNS